MPPKQIGAGRQASAKLRKHTGGPPGWAHLYNRIVEIRRTVRAPVDVIGCHKLFEPRVRGTEDERFQTLVSLMLSAQTKDLFTAEAVCNLQNTTAGLSVSSIASMDPDEINRCIRMVGMHNNKTKYLKAAAEVILNRHHGVVPDTLDGLLALPGVGPKMAHLFLQCADKKCSGIGVDVHVHRIAKRFAWVPPDSKTPEDSRKALESWLPRKHWGEINELLVGFGQTVCTPQRPKCHLCAANDLCPNAFKESAAKRSLSESVSTAVHSAAPHNATPEELLQLCGGSAKELLARGWLTDALPPVQVPAAIQARLDDELHASARMRKRDRKSVV